MVESPWYTASPRHVIRQIDDRAARADLPWLAELLTLYDQCWPAYAEVGRHAQRAALMLIEQRYGPLPHATLLSGAPER
jgi:hypothetical protein